MTETMVSDVTLRVDMSELSKYAENAKKAVETISNRAGKQGQFLNWIGFLPENQIKNIIEESWRDYQNASIDMDENEQWAHEYGW